MSIRTMVELGIERQQERTTPRATVVAGGNWGKSLDSAMERIVAFVPSEVIGIYVVGLGILSPESNAGKWWIFVISLLLIPVFMLLNYLGKKKSASPSETVTLPKKTTAVLFFFALVAFTAWAAALPATPFLSINRHATAAGGWSVLILTGIMYKVADLLDAVPKSH
jgi:hypothetical protein